MNNHKIVDISLPLSSDFKMHTPAGVQNVQLTVDVIKEHDAVGGAGQIVRSLYARLHHGTHIDAPEHFVRGAAQVQDLALTTFIGPAVVADVRHRGANEGITPEDLEKAVDGIRQPGDRLLINTGWTANYGKEGYAENSPYLTPEATRWCAEEHFPIVGLDFAHTKDAPDAPSKYYTTRHFCETGVVTMGYIRNLEAIQNRRSLLIALPLALHGVEASPVRAVVLDGEV